jgi:hypothetical protein
MRIILVTVMIIFMCGCDSSHTEGGISKCSDDVKDSGPPCTENSEKINE